MASGEILFIEGEEGGRFPDANSLFVDDEIPVIIDPATRPTMLERIKHEKGVRLVINTHYHVDHVRYNSLFPEAEFMAHELDAPAISSLDECARIVGVSGQPWEDLWRIGIQSMYGYAETPVARTFSGGEEMSLGKNTIRFIHTPGHTPGHTCIEFIERRAVYLADIDLTPFGPWYGNRYSDIDDFLRSLELIKGVDADTWYTSHEEGVIHGDITGRLDKFAAVVEERDNRILEFLGEPRSVPEVIDRTFIYGKRWNPPQMFDFFEGMMLEKHLARLERLGRVTSDGGRWLGAD